MLLMGGIGDFFRGLLGRRAPKPAPKPDFHAMVRGILSTQEDEIDCDECFELLDRFADMVLEGKNAEEAYPLVKEHLEHCGDCREEFEALLKALGGMKSK